MILIYQCTANTLKFGTRTHILSIPLILPQVTVPAAVPGLSREADKKRSYWQSSSWLDGSYLANGIWTSLSNCVLMRPSEHDAVGLKLFLGKQSRNFFKREHCRQILEELFRNSIGSTYDNFGKKRLDLLQPLWLNSTPARNLSN